MSGLTEFEHRTADELEFLRGLGAYCARPHNRAELLRKYLTAAAHRIEWGRINKQKAIAMARRLLRNEQGIIP